jgi:hypothetical protein
MSTALQPLWAIEAELQQLLDCVAICEAALQPELQERIQEYLAREAAKVDQTAHVLAALDYEQKAAGDEMARLAERIRTAKTAQDRLEKYLCRIIAARGGQKLIGNTNTLSVRPSDAVVIVDEAAIPACYIVEEVVTTKRVDKAAIKKALKAGREVPGADLEYRDNLVRK